MTENENKTFQVTLNRLPHGGFLVSQESPYSGSMAQFLYASSTIDDALAYVKKRLETDHD